MSTIICRNSVQTGRKQYMSFCVILARFKWKKNPILCDCRSLPANATVFKGVLFSLKAGAGLFILLRVPQSYKLLTKPRPWPVFQFWRGNNHPITQFLAAQFDAGGQKIGPLFAFQRVFVIAGKFYLSRWPDPYLFWTVSHTINIAVWYEPRRSIFPFLVEKIWNPISNSFHCLAFYNGNYGCLSHFLQQCVKRLSVI